MEIGDTESYRKSSREGEAWLGSLTPDKLSIREIPIRGLFTLVVLSHCECNVTFTAKLLGISVPAVTTQLSRLEKELGIDVVRRAIDDRRRLELTTVGKNLASALGTNLPALLNLAISCREARETAFMNKTDDVRRSVRQRKQRALDQFPKTHFRKNYP